MNLLDYVRIFVRRAWLIVLLAVVAAGVTFVLSSKMTPEYRGSQTVLIIPSRPDWGLAQAAVQLLNSRKEYLSSSYRAADVIDQLQLDIEPYTLLGKTNIGVNRDNMAIEITVDMPANDDAEAARILDPIVRAWADQLVQFQNAQNQEARREDRIQTNIKDNPTISRLRPNLRVNTLVGALAGLFLGAVLVFVLEFLESAVIHRRADIERATELPVLAVIPE